MNTSEIINSRAGAKIVQMMSDFDVFTKILGYTPEEATGMIERRKVQDLESIKMQILANNPHITSACEKSRRKEYE